MLSYGTYWRCMACGSFFKDPYQAKKCCFYEIRKVLYNGHIEYI